MVNGGHTLAVLGCTALLAVAGASVGAGDAPTGTQSDSDVPDARLVVQEVSITPATPLVGSPVTLSASVTGTTVTVRGWGASGGLTVTLVDDTGETVATRQFEAGSDGFRARLSAPDAGSYRVVARSDGTSVEKAVRVRADEPEAGAF
ncbi:hypothetical protein [Halorientalis pallida]|uniref:Uncharacterized protein n=1 Tax=Halorientalis pallida TaxID=2479928 RepID=A0A498KZ58_9EURY|nr:hypothetical protein [Halorientalis pallida]RXK47323.1 hypothetical protein EAF64_16200 [Halorientalis pallida]